MSSRAIAAVAALCLIAVIGMFAWAANGDADQAREHNSMWPCTPPVLVLERPPSGARETRLDPFISGAHRQVWAIGEGFLEVTSGAHETAVVLGDETAEVRGHTAEVGRLAIAAEDDPHVVVSWMEFHEECGLARYTVASNVLRAPELINLAQSLRVRNS